MNPASSLSALTHRVAAKRFRKEVGIGVAIGVAITFASSGVAWAAFSSGSTGSDGPFNPTVNTEVVLPPSGVLNYTTVNIPTGVTVTFKKNATNTPVTLLVQADATIAGTIDISGKKSADTGSGGSGNIGDDGLSGVGGPGGFDGGRGGVSGANRSAGAGLGPGAGGGGNTASGTITGGGGAGFAVTAPTTPWYTNNPQNTGVQGVAYGAAQSLPLIGGSGGGGGAGGSSFAGAGGGGGGGALLIAASGTISVTGTINASGGATGIVAGDGEAAAGGAGSGGAIRLVATTIAGNGTLVASGQTFTVPSVNRYSQSGGESSPGRIRLEAETYTRTAASSPVHSFAAPGSVFIAGAPSLRITSVAGTSAPASPTGTNDVQLPATITNPVTVQFAATGVPVGNIIKLTVTPATGAPTSAVSDALTGSTANSTSSTTITLPQGPSTLQATITYTIVAALGDALRNFAGNERVERIEVAAAQAGRGESEIRLITTSGKSFIASPAAVRLLSEQG